MKTTKRICALLLALLLLLGCAGAEGLTTGAKGEAVERLQERLYYLGFLTIQPDGDYGPKTVEAVADFQTFFRARGYDLRSDGVADEKTQALLYDDSVADADYPLKEGDKNGYVRRAQRRLVELGYLFGAADGNYGQNTADAVRAFQQMLIDNGAEGITASGEADENTLHYLYSELLGFDICTPTMYNDGNPLSLRAGNLYAQAAVLIDADSGEVLWRQNRATADTGVAEGWYWAGAAASENDVVIGGESGAVELRDGGTGDVLSSVDVGAPVRASVVAVPGEEGAFLAVSYDGALHKVMRTGDALALAGSVSFAPKSTSTPSVVEGMALVGGLDAEGYGTLSVIDLATMKVSSTVRAGKGEVQSAPLVSVLPDGIWAYFTCNANPGGVYAYKLGDASAYQLYVPETGMQQHCTASVVTDARGNLYYTNDSGTLFKLAAARGFLVTFNTAGGSFVPQTQVADGHALARPADPVRQGYVFGGWFADAACTRAWDFATPVTAPLTLHAKWTPKEDAKEPEEPQKPQGSEGLEGPHGSDEPQNQGGQDGSADNASAPDDAAVGGAVPAATAPLGAVAPAAAPLAADTRTDAQQTEALAASVDGAAAPKETRSAGSDVLAMSETVAEAAERHMPTIALIGLAAGAALLLAAAAWLAILRKREKEGGAR